MTLQRSPLLPLILLAASSPLPGAEAFAAWLKCWTDLLPGEVIMNHEVLSASDSQSPEVKVVAYRRVRTADGATERVEAEADENLGGIPYDEGEEFSIHLVLPEGEFAHTDVQWAADVTEEGAARFLGDYPGDPTVQCDGRRGVGKKKSSELRIKMEGEGGPMAETWAGWATEHEAVSLTERLRFVSRRVGPPKAPPGPPKGTAPGPPPGPPKTKKEVEEEEKKEEEL